jgi:transcriptional regulator with XRE-family HTH domain
MKVAERELTIGERVAYFRRRRGLTQLTLAGLVGRTASWMEKVESGRAPLDRLSVLRELAAALGVSLHDLLPQDCVETPPSRRAVPALRELVLSYRAVNPRFALLDADIAAPSNDELCALVNDVWIAYQDSRFGYTVMRLNRALPAAYSATRDAGDVMPTRCLAQLYHVAASVLVKLGSLDLARLCADRGDIAAQETEDPITLMSLQRGIAHSLLSNGQYADAAAVVRDGIIEAGPLANRNNPAGLSVVGTLMLVGATASARAGERREAMMFLRHARDVAGRLGADRNDVWTAFGPTNVAIHEVTVAADLGDLQRAVHLGSQLDVSRVPRERRVRHQLELARGLAGLGRRDEALRLLLDCERDAADQVRRHFITRQLVVGWLRATRTIPSAELVALARRLGQAA